MARITTLPPAKDSEPRARLLAKASALFYVEGVNSVGVDRIVSEAHVTRATFYRHFPSKQDLVLAYLQSVHDAIEDRTAAAAELTDPSERLRALADDIAAQVQSPGFRGCAFIKVASEFDDPDEPVRRAVTAHRAWFAGIVRTAFTDAGHARPDEPMRHFIMLRDGAMVGGYLDGPAEAARTFTRGVNGILRFMHADPE